MHEAVLQKLSKLVALFKPLQKIDTNITEN